MCCAVCPWTCSIAHFVGGQEGEEEINKHDRRYPGQCACPARTTHLHCKQERASIGSLFADACKREQQTEFGQLEVVSSIIVQNRPTKTTRV